MIRILSISTTSGGTPFWLDWLSSTAPIVTLMATFVAAIIAWQTLKQPDRADRRDQWWQRTQWAMDLAIHGTLLEKNVGVSALDQLAKSDLLGPEEETFLSSVTDDLKSIVVDSVESEEDTEGNSQS
jgi:hypothetical protein